jgi:hypothetical protein
MVALLGVYEGDNERVTGLWAGAQVGGDGSARVVEVIDYDFGTSSRHGIYRDVPGLSPDARVEVSSPTAPDDVVLVRSGSGTRIRVGDPTRTVSGRHRYMISYPLDDLAGGRLAWDAVGTQWTVGIGHVEIHVVAPFALQGISCVLGEPGSQRACGVAQPEPGHLVARVDHLGKGQGLTLFASHGPALGDAPSLPAPPVGAVTDEGPRRVVFGLLAGVMAMLGAAPVSRLVRLAGRERVAGAETGAVEPGTDMRVDREDLASQVSPSPEPPAGLTPAQGGILLAEAVRDQHKVAWLISAALEGYLDIEESGKKLTLVRRPRPHTDSEGAVPSWGSPTSPNRRSTAALLDLAFPGTRSTAGGAEPNARLRVGKYQARFAKFWQALDDDLAAWQRASELWDPAGDRRRTLVRIVGGVASLAGLAATAGGAALANRFGSALLGLVAAGALTAGAGLAALVKAWELRVLTPAGSALWLQVESFRRFLAESHASDVEEAAERGRLRECTPWAVALGEAEGWWARVASSAVAGAASTGLSQVTDDSLRYARLAPALSSSTSASSTAPSSGGSGGGSSSSSSGGGGGGGGSW